MAAKMKHGTKAKTNLTVIKNLLKAEIAKPLAEARALDKQIETIYNKISELEDTRTKVDDLYKQASDIEEKLYTIEDKIEPYRRALDELNFG